MTDTSQLVIKYQYGIIQRKKIIAEMQEKIDIERDWFLIFRTVEKYLSWLAFGAVALSLLINAYFAETFVTAMVILVVAGCFRLIANSNRFHYSQKIKMQKHLKKEIGQIKAFIKKL